MNDLFEFIKSIIATRGAQLASRYVAKALLIVATWAHVAPDADGHTTAFIVSLLVALAGMAVDLISHALQQNAAKDLAEDQKARAVIEAVNNDARSKFGKASLIFVLCLLPFLSACNPSHPMEAISAAVASGVESAMTRIHTSFNFDPTTMTATAQIQFKDAEGRDVVQVLTPEELRAQCLQCNDQAQAALKASYKQALKDLEVVQKREIAKLKAQRAKCGYQSIPPPQMISVPPPSGPQVGDVLNETPIPDPNNVDAHGLPESGTMKGGKK